MSTKPAPYVVYYDDKEKLAALTARSGADYEPHPSLYRSAVEAQSLDDARHLARTLLQGGYLMPQIFERSDVVLHEDTYEWDEEFVEDVEEA